MEYTPYILPDMNSQTMGSFGRYLIFGVTEYWLQRHRGHHDVVEDVCRIPQQRQGFKELLLLIIYIYIHVNI